MKIDTYKEKCFRSTSNECKTSEFQGLFIISGCPECFCIWIFADSFFFCHQGSLIWNLVLTLLHYCFKNLQKTAVASFEASISDVIGCRFENVRNGHRFVKWMPIWEFEKVHRFENWTPIWEFEKRTYRRSEVQMSVTWKSDMDLSLTYILLLHTFN